jgi:hypothetical protein
MTDKRALITVIGEQRGIIEKQKIVIDELNENYLKLNSKFDASEAKIEAANKILYEDDDPYFDNLNQHQHSVITKADRQVKRLRILFPRTQEQKEENPLCPYCGELTTRVKNCNNKPAYSCFKCKRVTSCSKDYLEAQK